MSPAQRSWKGSHSKAFAIQLIGTVHRSETPGAQELGTGFFLSSLLARRNRCLKALLSSGITAIDNIDIIRTFVGRVCFSSRSGRTTFASVSMSTVWAPGTRSVFPKFKTDVVHGEFLFATPATFFSRSRRLGDIGPSPTFWQGKAARCQFGTSQQPLWAMRACRQQHKGHSTYFLAGNEPLAVNFTRTIRRRR